MSANRIVNRRVWLAGAHDTYHDYAIATGQRHPSFQKSIRQARIDLGLPVTSTDMHNLHGRRI